MKTIVTIVLSWLVVALFAAWAWSRMKARKKTKAYPGIPAGICDEDLEEHMSEKSLMKLASDLGVPFSAAKIISDHVRAEYDAKLRAADALCEAARTYRELTTCYRLGRKPSEILFKRLDEADKAIADYEEAP